VTRQVSSTAICPLVLQLNAYGWKEGTHELETCLAIVKQAKISAFILAINGESADVPRRCVGFAQGVTPSSSGLVS
jgi:hypothetical protein